MCSTFFSGGLGLFAWWHQIPFVSLDPVVADGKSSFSSVRRVDAHEFFQVLAESRVINDKKKFNDATSHMLRVLPFLAAFFLHYLWSFSSPSFPHTGSACCRPVRPSRFPPWRHWAWLGPSLRRSCLVEAMPSRLGWACTNSIFVLKYSNWTTFKPHSFLCLAPRCHYLRGNEIFYTWTCFMMINIHKEFLQSVLSPIFFKRPTSTLSHTNLSTTPYTSCFL